MAWTLLASTCGPPAPGRDARPGQLLGQVVGEPAGQHGPEQGRPDRAAHLRKKGGAGRRAHVRRSTEFCTAVTIVCMVNPRPAPNRYSKMATCQNGVSTSEAQQGQADGHGDGPDHR